jgi:hypothetical protein
MPTARWSARSSININISTEARRASRLQRSFAHGRDPAVREAHGNAARGAVRFARGALISINVAHRRVLDDLPAPKWRSMSGRMVRHESCFG